MCFMEGRSEFHFPHDLIPVFIGITAAKNVDSLSVVFRSRYLTSLPYDSTHLTKDRGWTGFFVDGILENAFLTRTSCVLIGRVCREFAYT